jgi:sec-independent protein translocase protein TatC
MIEEKEMSFLDHLEELRWHIVRSVFAIMIFVVLAFVYTPWIFEHIIFGPARADFATFKFLCRVGDWVKSDGLCVKYIPFRVQSRNMTGQFTMQFTAGFVIGLICAFPYVVWEIWRFVKPGLHNRELKLSRGVVSSVTFLFILGISFGYFVMCPMSIYFFTSYSISPMIVNEFDITSYVSTVVTLVLGSGLLFQLPVVVFFLTQMGILTPQFMRKYRRHAVIVILIIGAFITPPDPISQTVISIPLYLLYEVSIFISAYAMRKKQRAEAAELLLEEKNP